MAATTTALAVSPTIAKTSRGEQIGGSLAVFSYQVLFSAFTGERLPDVSGEIRPQCSTDDFRRFEAFSAAADVAGARQLYSTCDLSKAITLLDEDDTVFIQDLFKVPDEHCAAYATILETAFSRFRQLNPDITKDPVLVDNPTDFLRPQFAVQITAMRQILQRGAFAAGCKRGEGLHLLYVWKLKGIP
jgi:hypothetical protein